MPTTTEPTRLQLDLREDTWINPGRTMLAWETPASRLSRPAGTVSGATVAECSCPIECPRDHETD